MNDKTQPQGSQDDYISPFEYGEDVEKAFAKILGVDVSKIAGARIEDMPGGVKAKSGTDLVYSIGDQDLAQGLADKINSAFRANEVTNGQQAPHFKAYNGKVLLSAGATFSKKLFQEYLDTFSNVAAEYGDEIVLHRKLAESLAGKVQGKESLSDLFKASSYDFKINGKDTHPENTHYENGNFTGIPEAVKQAALKTAKDILTVIQKNGKKPEDFKELVPYSKIDEDGSHLSEKELAAALIAGAMLSERDNLQPDKAPITSTIRNSARLDELKLSEDIVEKTYTAFTVAKDIFDIGVGSTPKTFSKAISRSEGKGTSK